MQTYGNSNGHTPHFGAVAPINHKYFFVNKKIYVYLRRFLYQMGKKKIKWHIKGLNLTDKYRLSIYNDTNYEEFLHFQLKGREVLVALAISIVILITATTVLIAFTPIREFIPGYPDETTRKMMQNNVLKADSLEKVINEWTVYVNNSIRVLSGNSTQILQNPPDSSFATKTFQDVRSRQDSIFRTQIEKEEQFNFKSNSQNKENDISEIHFITPLKGKITSSFDMGENHLGVDIVSSPDDIVLAVLEGTVIMSEWTVETGNVIQIQHSNNL
ncbi:MAG: M23 family metallopeptidase, partial [Prevotellaceae bacterium]|nr:M23 family metallopeptidase [Prevotellaceae bacterium]